MIQGLCLLSPNTVRRSRNVKFTAPIMKGGFMNPKFRKALIKWGLSCLGLILTFEIFGNIGILFGVGLCYVIISYL